MDQHLTKVFKNQNESETIILWGGQEGTAGCFWIWTLQQFCDQGDEQNDDTSPALASWLS